jgi:hypothetical protein
MVLFLDNNNTSEKRNQELMIINTDVDHELAMGASTSAILAEICIQYLEHTSIINILKNHHMIDYFR